MLVLVFKKGEWHTVSLPNYSDPSWTFSDRQKVASTMLKWLQKGFSESEAFMKAEDYASRGNNIAPQSTKKNSAV